VKDEGFNLNTMTITLKSIICFEILGLEVFKLILHKGIYKSAKPRSNITQSKST
jgi:hypothetical protein